MSIEEKASSQLRLKLVTEVWLWVMGVSYYLALGVNKTVGLVPDRILVLCYLCPFMLVHLVCSQCTKSQNTRAMVRLSIPLATALLRLTFYNIGVTPHPLLDGFLLSTLQVGLLINCWVYEGLLLPLTSVYNVSTKSQMASVDETKEISVKNHGKFSWPEMTSDPDCVNLTKNSNT